MAKAKKSSAKKVDNRKPLEILGVIILFIAIIYGVYYFFFKNSDITKNMSTDKKFDYIDVAGKTDPDLIATQKYVSDLDYSMRYDIEQFRVLKVKGNDIYKYLKSDGVALMVSKSEIPSNCVNASLDMLYSTCLIKIDKDTEEYYVGTSEGAYKITIKTNYFATHADGFKERVNYMLSSFIIN